MRRKWIDSIAEPGIPANVAWGPDFGESSDGNTVTIGVGVVVDAFTLETTQNPSIHISGSLEGPPFWQDVQTATDANAVAFGSITVTKPAGTVSGDFLLAAIGILKALGGTTVNTPAGWTLGRQDQQGDITSAVFWRIADGTEAGTFTFTFASTVTHATAEVHRIAGAHGTAPFETSAVTKGPATDFVLDPVAPSVTIGFAQSLPFDTWFQGAPVLHLGQIERFDFWFQGAPLFHPSAPQRGFLVFVHLYHDHPVGATHTPPAHHRERTDFESVLGAARTSSTTSERVFLAPVSTDLATVDCTEVVATSYIVQRIAIRPVATFILAG